MTATDRLDIRRQLRLGLACSWWHPRVSTWSYTATRLRDALDDHAQVSNIDAQRSLAGKVLLRALHAPLSGRPWQYSALEGALTDRAVRRQVRRRDLDAVLAIADVDTPTSAPTFLYQDMNAAVALAQHEVVPAEYVNTLPAKPELLRRRGERQLARIEKAAGVFAMSQWYAQLLIRQFGVRADKVAVVPAGMNNPPVAYRDPAQPVSGRVLFVGTDFFRKGGDLVVEAVRRLRDGGDTRLQLTVVGPGRWPLAGDPPSWVDFKGLLPPAEVSALLPRHDAFAMPSRFEAFGIALAEALIAGLPCVARDASAMPEIVQDPETGALVRSDDPDELAGALRRVLADPDIHARVAAARPRLIARHTWASAAGTIASQIASRIGVRHPVDADRVQP